MKITTVVTYQSGICKQHHLFLLSKSRIVKRIISFKTFSLVHFRDNNLVIRLQCPGNLFSFDFRAITTFSKDNWKTVRIEV